MNVAKQHEAGIRTRQQNVQRVAACLRWATSKKGGFLLNEYWIPPEEGNLKDYIGRKSREKQIETDAPTIPLLDDDFLKINLLLLVRKILYPQDLKNFIDDLL